jgi:hypothetical protein
MVIKHFEKLFVIDIPQRSAGLVLTEKADVSHQLAKSHIIGKLIHLDQYLNCFPRRGRNHGLILYFSIAAGKCRS